MSIPCSVVMVWVAGVTVAGAVSAQAYPNRPIRIVTSEPGGSNDFPARLIAQGLAGPLGQNVIVENRPSTLLGEFVARATPDGYTLLAAGGTFVIGPLLKKANYDPVKDFSPITLVGITPNILVVHPSVPAKTVGDLIALAKSRPGELNYASGGSGSANYLAAELFKTMTGTDIVRIPYKGTGPALNGLMAAQMQMMFPNAGGATQHVKLGKLKALAVTSAQASTLAPGLPTVAATVPGYESSVILGLWAPAKTPPQIIVRLNREIVRILNVPETKARLFNNGIEVVGSTTGEFTALIKSNMARLGKLIRDIGVRDK